MVAYDKIHIIIPGTVDLFYKSYLKDFKWLEYSLRSVDKYLTGYDKIHIVVPGSEFKYLPLEITSNSNVFVYPCDEYGNGYLYQQFIKMRAHKYSSADFILFCDSDIIFDRPTNLQDVIADGRPEILYTDYVKVGDAQCWREPTERFMNAPQQWEYMRRLPLIYHRSTIENIYNLVPNLEQIIMNSDRFSEFNAIGAWAFAHEQNKYKFVNTEDWQYVPHFARQFWSWSGLDSNDLTEINKLLQ